MSWRVAESLLTLRDQINKIAPSRSKVSDGTIGDAGHKSRSSDHNPWVTSGDLGIVTAMDITHDPRNGMDCAKLADQLISSNDLRIKYIIFNRRIWNPSKSLSWREYKGANPHDKHLHISVNPSKSLYDNTDPWDIQKQRRNSKLSEVVEHPLLQMHTDNPNAVRLLKELLINHLLDEDGFGVLTDKFVRAFQRAKNLGVDGKVGQYTWEKLLDGA